MGTVPKIQKNCLQTAEGPDDGYKDCPRMDSALGLPPPAVLLLKGDSTENPEELPPDSGSCVHHPEHDAACGYTEENPVCTFVCAICAVQRQIDALLTVDLLLHRAHGADEGAHGIFLGIAAGRVMGRMMGTKIVPGWIGRLVCLLRYGAEF